MAEMVNPQELRRLMTEATDGPWLAEYEYVGVEDFWICRCFSDVNRHEGEPGGQNARNAAFIAILPDLAKAYLALVERDARIIGMMRNRKVTLIDVWDELAKEAPDA